MSEQPDALRHPSLVGVYKFPHVSSRFMDNPEPGPVRGVKRQAWNSVESTDRHGNSAGHVRGIKHTDENIPRSLSSTVATCPCLGSPWWSRTMIAPLNRVPRCFEAPTTATVVSRWYRRCDLPHTAGSTLCRPVIPSNRKEWRPSPTKVTSLIVDAWAGPRLNSPAL